MKKLLLVLFVLSLFISACGSPDGGKDKCDNVLIPCAKSTEIVGQLEETRDNINNTSQKVCEMAGGHQNSEGICITE